mmetsp:Transcript_13836/g.26380  ORF Transcript_13836/g.26380 Transcript_13836/m.26380 type:complete len:313 (+) Transcript_13836:182-1120(+)
MSSDGPKLCPSVLQKDALLFQAVHVLLDLLQMAMHVIHILSVALFDLCVTERRHRLPVLGPRAPRQMHRDALAALSIALASALQAAKHRGHPAPLLHCVFALLPISEHGPELLRRPGAVPCCMSILIRSGGVILFTPLLPELGRARSGRRSLEQLIWEQVPKLNKSIPVLIEEREEVQDPAQASELLPPHAGTLHTIAEFLHANSATATQVHRPEGLHWAAYSLRELFSEGSAHLLQTSALIPVVLAFVCSPGSQAPIHGRGSTDSAAHRVLRNKHRVHVLWSGISCRAEICSIEPVLECELFGTSSAIVKS